MEHDKLWLKISQQLFALCSRFDDICFQRRRRFSVSDVLIGILQLKCGAHESYRSIFSDWSEPPAGSSFSEARSKVPAYLFGEVRANLLETWNGFLDQAHAWKGFNVFAIDGSKINVPRKLVNENFRVAKNNYYPQGLLSVLFSVTDRTIHGLDFTKEKSERQAASRLIENLGVGDLLIFDKGYFSFGLMCEVFDRGIDAVFAIQEGTVGNAISAFKESDLTELIVEIDGSKDGYRRARLNHPEATLSPRKMRLIKYKYAGKIEILATTLLCSKIKSSEIIALYKYRWRIEELYKSFKTTLNVENFHSKTENGVEQELHAASILWNLSRKISDLVPATHFKKIHYLYTNNALSGEFYAGFSRC